MENRNFNAEFTFKMSRSAGKGGQHVNKVSTKVELLFHVASSACLTADEKTLIADKLSNRISKDGILRLSAQNTRSQLKNKTIAIKRFYDLVSNALTIQKPRKKAKLPKSVKEKRLRTKKHLGQKKTLRKKVSNPNGTDLFLLVL